MSEITKQDEMRAAMHRLRERDGYPAVEALLAKVGVASVSQVTDAAYEQVMAACPELPRGQGIMAAAGIVAAGGDDEKTPGKHGKIRQALNNMGADRNAKVNAAKQGEDIGNAMKTVLDGPGGFDAAAKAMNARGGLKSAK